MRLNRPSERGGGKRYLLKTPLTFQFVSCHPIILSWTELTARNGLRATPKWFICKIWEMSWREDGYKILRPSLT